MDFEEASEIQTIAKPKRIEHGCPKQGACFPAPALVPYNVTASTE